MRRVPLYIGLTVGFAVAAGMATALGDNGNPRLAYVCTLFALCSSPLLFGGKLNGRHSILWAFMPLYFIFYGASDLLDLAAPKLAPVSEPGLLSLAELGVLAGAALVILGYSIGVAATPTARAAPRDWSGTNAVLVGLALWGAGAAATWIWQIDVLQRAFGEVQGVGNLEALSLTVGRLVQPLGIVLLAYRFVVSRSPLLGLVLLGVLAAEFAIGFLGDSKELALRGAALVVLVKYLLEGRVPKMWFVVAGLVVLVSFPVFQAYRTEVLSRGKDRAAAAQQIGKNLDKTLGSDALASGEAIYGWRSALHRVSLKPTLELTIARVGTEAAFQEGRTISLLFTGFVPRFLWPTKPDTSVGQLFNRELRISEFRDVYISATQLAELYWNFGWPGVFGGMTLIGVVLGFVGARCDLSQGRSVTRLLVISVTIYLLCVRFEANIAMAYIQWIRSLAAIAVLHLMFANARSGLPARHTGTLTGVRNAAGAHP